MTEKYNSVQIPIGSLWNSELVLEVVPKHPFCVILPFHLEQNKLKMTTVDLDY